MKVYCVGTARIRRNETDDVFEIESGDLDWNTVSSDERQMGPEINYEAIVEHPQLGELIWSLSEYPVGFENSNQTNAGPHELIADFRYGLQHDESEPEIWVDFSAPDNPFTIFMDSYYRTGDLLADHGSDRGNHLQHLLNRMIFSQQVTALEAYLGDTLLNAVMADTAAMQRLIEQEDDLAKEKFTLAEISREPRLVERRIREHLRSILYHNLAKVDVLYNIALGVRILRLTGRSSSLFKAVMLRHDCVHRNGFDKDGAELTVFSKAFVQGTADLIKTFVEGVEKAVRARS